MKRIFLNIFVAVMAFGLVSCNNDGKDIVVKETDYAEVFLNTFEEKLSLVFHTAERNLRRGNQDFELLFKNAYMEVLGSYADISTFENAFLEASDRTHSVRTRSNTEETVFMNLTYKVIESSETKKEAIGKFDALANDVSLDLEDRVGFISMREFLSFYENNEELIILAILKESPDDFDEVLIKALSGRRLWRCLLGSTASAASGAATMCLGAAYVLKPKPKPMIIGCAAGWIVGGWTGKFYGLAYFCL